MNLDTDARISRPTSNRVAYAAHQQVSLHDTQTGKLVWVSPQPASWRGQEYHGGIYPVAVCLAPDAGAIAMADRQQLKLFKPALGTNAEVIATFDRGVTAMDWSADGKYIAVAGRSLDILEIMELEKTERPDAITARNAELRQVRLMRPDGTLVGTLPQTANLSGLAFSPDSRQLAVMDWENDGIRIHNVATRRREFVIPVWAGERVLHESLTGLVWSPDGRFIAVTRRGGGVILCDVNRRIPVAKSSVASNSPMNINSPIAFSPDSSAVIARCTDRKLRFWDLEVWRGKN